MSELKLFASIQGRYIRVGGKEHSGWLPEGFVKPRPTPERNLKFNFEIRDDGGGHFIFYHESEDGSILGDTWHETLEDAINQAQHDFGIIRADWTLHS